MAMTIETLRSESTRKALIGKINAKIASLTKEGTDTQFEITGLDGWKWPVAIYPNIFKTAGHYALVERYEAAGIFTPKYLSGGVHTFYKAEECVDFILDLLINHWDTVAKQYYIDYQRACGMDV